MEIRNRQQDFDRIRESLSPVVRYSSCNAIVAVGDSISLLPQIADHTVSLVLTDPPYHSTKKKNIANDRAFDADEDYLNWLQRYVSEWRRVLRPNGSLLLFCSSAMAARIEVLLSSQFNVLSQIVWTKPNDPGFDGWKQKMNKLLSVTATDPGRHRN